jgi:hypothetical protein
MKVTSNRSVEFPKLNWAIAANETRDLPDDKDAQKVILSHRSIHKAKERALTN